jgi:hypothetical protein
MGITFNSATPPSAQGVDVSRDLDTGRTYLVVVKYQFIPGAANDSVSLYVFEDGANISTEPAKADAGPVAGTQNDVNLMQYIALRQFNAGQRITVDGLIVRNNWEWLAASAPKAPLLLSPANNSTLNLDGPAGTPVSISWSAVRNVVGNVVYEWQADARAGGNFNPPALALPSDNSGADTVLSLTYGAIETALASLGVQPGDTLKAVWRVRATAGNDTLYSNVYNIDLIRKGNGSAADEIRELKEFSLYPNPGNGYVELHTNAVKSGMLHIRVFDALGRLVFTGLEPAGQPARISLETLPEGIYMIDVHADGISFSPQRLMIGR